MTVEELTDKLLDYPEKASVHVYTGEASGIVILGETGDNLGMIEATMYDRKPEPDPPEAESA